MSKQKVFILHGWSNKKNTHKRWQPIINLLNNNYEPIYLKIPGLSKKINQIWKPNDYLLWLEKKLENETNLHLIGHSFGARLWLEYAAKNSEKIKKLIIIDSGGIRNQTILAKLKRIVFNFLAKIGKKVTKHNLPRKILYKICREKDYFEASPLLRQTMINMINKDIREEIKKVKCQTLIIWGKKDTITPIKISKIFQSNIKKSKLIKINDAKHAPHYSHPQQVFNYINNFFTNKI